MKKTLIHTVALALISYFPFPAAAQDNGDALAFSRIPHAPQSMAMGGAGIVSSSSVAFASYTNAAVIPYSDKTMDVSAGYLGWQPSCSLTNMLNIAGAYNINGKFGIALGFTYGMNEAYEVTDERGYVTGEFRPSDLQVNIGLSWRFLPYLAIGADVKYLNSSLAEEYSYGAVSSDIFLMSEISDFKVAIGVSSIGSRIKAASGPLFSLPASVALGAGYDRVFNEKHGLEILLDLNYYFSGTFTASAGAAYTFNDMVSLRGGYHYGGKSILPSYASVGFGLNFWGVHIDTAYLISSGPIKNTFSVGLGYSF